MPCAFAFADAPVISDVRIAGARLLSERDLRGGLETRPGGALDSLALRRDVGRILERCRSAGLYRAEVASPEVVLEGGRAAVTFRLAEGTPARVGALVIDGADSLDLLRGMATRPGGLFRPGTLEADVEAILRRYEDAGHPFCAVYPTVSPPSADGRVDVTLRVEAGPTVRVGDLRISGNRVTRSGVVGRLMGLRPGEVYDQRRVDRGRRALLRSGLFDAVEEAQLRPDARNGTVDLFLRVVERKASRVEGAVGYAPGAAGGKGYVAGLLDLALKNLAGTGRGVSLRWERKGPSASDLRLGYAEPWIGAASLSGRFGMDLLQRPGYAVAEVRGGVGMPLAGALDAELEVGWAQASPDSSGLTLALRGRTWRGRGGVSADTRDDPDNPRTGTFLRVAASLERSALQAGAVSRWRYEAEAERLVPLFRGQALALSAHAQGIRTGEAVLPLQEKVRLGGASSLRGYEEEQFAGVRTAWGSAEYRVLAGRRSRVFLFVDAGAITDRVVSGAGVRRQTLYRTGYGAGLRAASRAGIVGIDFGVGQDGGLLQAKAHVRMTHAF